MPAVQLSTGTLSGKMGRLGPFQDSSGNLWTILPQASTGSALALMSSDGGQTWADQSSASKPGTGGTTIDLAFDATNQYIYALFGTSGASPIHRWNIASKTWTLSWCNIGSGVLKADVNGDFPAFICVRSNGTLVLVYEGPTVSNMGTPYRQVYYNTITTAGALGTATLAHGMSGSTTHVDLKGACVGASDRIHILTAGSNNNTYSVSLSSANALDTPLALNGAGNGDTNYATIFYNATLGKVVAGGCKPTGTPTTPIRWNSAAGPGSGNLGTADTNNIPDSPSGSCGAVFAYDTSSGTLFAVYCDSTSADVTVGQTKTNTWGTPTVLDVTTAPVAISAQPITGAIGVVYYDTTTFWWFDKYSLGPVAVNMTMTARATTAATSPVTAPAAITASASATTQATATVVYPAPAFLSSPGFVAPGAYNAAVKNDNPLNHWPLDDKTGTAARELIWGASNNATYQGGFTLGQPGIGDGSTSVKLDGAAATKIVTTVKGWAAPWSIEFWINQTGPAAGGPYGAGITKTNSNIARPFDWYLSSGTVFFGSGATLNPGTVIPTGTWHHHVGVFDGGTLSTYLDGVLTASAATGGGSDDTSKAIVIGSRDDGLTTLNGYIAKAAVYGYNLSATQVLNHYKAASQPGVGAVAATQAVCAVATPVPLTLLTSAATTAATATVTAPARLAPTAQAQAQATNTVVTKVALPLTAGATTAATATVFIPIVPQYLSSPGFTTGADRSYAHTVLADGATAFWPLNDTPGATQLADRGPGGYNLPVPAGLVLGSPGVGNDSMVTVPAGIACNVTQSVSAGQIYGVNWSDPLGPNTLEMWSDLDVTQGSVIPFNLASYGDYSWAMQTYAGGLSYRSHLAPNYPETGWRAFPLGMHHWVGVYDGTNMILYVDGQPVVSVPATGGQAIWSIQLFGANTFAKDIRYGRMAAYPKALTAAQVLSHYAAGNSQYDGVIVADTPQSYWPLNEPAGVTSFADMMGSGIPIAQQGTVGRVTGIGDGATAPDFAGTGYGQAVFTQTLHAPLSIECWFNPDVVPQGNTGAQLINSRYPNECGIDIQPGSASATTAHGDIGDGTNWLTFNADMAGITPPIAPGQWRHLVYTVGLTNFNCYVDGVQFGSGSLNTGGSYGPALLWDANHNLIICSNVLNTNYAGAVAKVAAYPYVLSQAQVQAHYTALTPIQPAVGAQAATQASLAITFVQPQNLTLSAVAATASTATITAKATLVVNAGATTQATASTTAPTRLAPAPQAATAATLTLAVGQMLALSAAAAANTTVLVTAASKLSATAQSALAATATITTATTAPLTPVAGAATQATGLVNVLMSLTANAGVTTAATIVLSAPLVQFLALSASASSAATASVAAPAWLTATANATGAATMTVLAATVLAPTAQATAAATAVASAPARLFLIPRAVVATDNFNLPDGPLGSGWTTGFDSPCVIASNQMKGSVGATWTESIRAEMTYSGDQFSEIQVMTPPIPSDWIGAIVRAQNNGQDCYRFIYYNNAGQYEVRLGKRASGTGSTFTTVVIGASPLPSGTTIAVSAEGQVLSLWINGAVVSTTTDASFSGGVPGIIAFGTTATADNWRGGNVTSAAAQATASISVGGIPLVAQAVAATQATMLVTASQVPMLMLSASASSAATVTLAARTLLTASAQAATQALATATAAPSLVATAAATTQATATATTTAPLMLEADAATQATALLRVPGVAFLTLEADATTTAQALVSAATRLTGTAQAATQALCTLTAPPTLSATARAVTQATSQATAPTALSALASATAQATLTVGYTVWLAPAATAATQATLALGVANVVNVTLTAGASTQAQAQVRAASLLTATAGAATQATVEVEVGSSLSLTATAATQALAALSAQVQVAANAQAQTQATILTTAATSFTATADAATAARVLITAGAISLLPFATALTAAQATVVTTVALTLKATAPSAATSLLTAQTAITATAAARTAATCTLTALPVLTPTAQAVTAARLFVVAGAVPLLAFAHATTTAKLTIGTGARLRLNARAQTTATASLLIATFIAPTAQAASQAVLLVAVQTSLTANATATTAARMVVRAPLVLVVRLKVPLSASVVANWTTAAAVDSTLTARCARVRVTGKAEVPTTTAKLDRTALVASVES